MEINEACGDGARRVRVCESCENPSCARGSRLPTARLCLSCKEKEERLARGGS